MSVAATPPPTPARSSTHFGLFSKIRAHKDSKLMTLQRPSSQRSSSHGTAFEQTPRGSLFSLPAQEGAGVKTRRLSIGPEVDFDVDFCQLEEEFVSASKIGRRKEIGKGASATVVIMARKGEKKGSLFAVKEYRKQGVNESAEEYVRKVKSEYSIGQSLNHPNIVRTVRLCMHNDRWNHVMEYSQQGDLFGLVEKRFFKTGDKYCIFKQVLRGVAHLHQRGIAHRDIKLENLLMTDDGYVKITDFGVSEVFCGQHPGLARSRDLCEQKTHEKRMSQPGLIGSKPYISPEVLAKDKEYDATKLDVWSCGILFLTLFFNGNPWQIPSKDETNYYAFIEGWEAFLEQFPNTQINEQNHPNCGPMFSTLPSQFQRRCILKMLHPIPEQRCTVEDALADRWVKGIDCCSPDPASRAKEMHIDVSKMGSEKAMAKMEVQAKHDHLPPPVKKLPQHRFDMGDGTSRYD